MILYKIGLVFLSALLVSLAAWSSDPTEKTTTEVSKDKKPKVTVEELDLSALDYIHYQLSQNILGLANRVDRFFANEKAILERNTSYVLMDQTYLYRYDSFYDFSIRANLSLPGTEDKVNIFLENTKDRVVNLSGFDGGQTLGSNEDETRIGARFGIYGDYRQNFSLTTRAGVKSFGFTWEKIDPFAELRGRYTKAWTPYFLTEAYITPRYSVVDLKEVQTGVKLDFTPLSQWLFRLANNSLWEENLHQTMWLSGISVVYTFSDEKAILTSFGIESRDNGGPHISGYNASLQYQQVLYYKWLNLQLTNYWEIPKWNNFKRISSFEILLRVRLGAL